jgi:hypothetical protein
MEPLPMSTDSRIAEPPEQAENRAPIRAALLLWLIFAVALAIKSLVTPTLHTVFPKFAAGAEHWWAGLPLYEEYENLGPFRYSPAFAIAMTPFAWLGLVWGGLLFALLNVGAYVWAVRRLARDVLPGEWPPVREAILLALAMPVAVRGLWNGQSNGLVAACLLLATAGLARQRWWLAAGLLSAAVYLKLSPLAVGLLFAGLVPGRLGPRLLGALVIGGLLPFLTASPEYVLDQYTGWFEHLVQTRQKRWPSFRDARTFWEWAGITTNLSVYAVLQAGAGITALGWCWWQKRRWDHKPRMWLTAALAAGIGYLLLFGPAIESPTYVLIAPIVAWAVLEAFATRCGRIVAVTVFVLMTAFMDGGTERALARLTPAAAVGLPASTLLLMFWLMAWGWRQRPGMEAESQTRDRYGLGPPAATQRP